MKNKVEETRKAMNITQEELARLSGISRPFLSDVERGIRTPSVKNSLAIASALNCAVEDIFLNI